MSCLISLSIVSHGQSALIAPLLEDLRRLALPDIEVVITVNIPEDETPFKDLPFPSRIVRNAAPQGFGANHNAAFAASSGRFFVVVNPDIRLPSLDVARLLALMEDPTVGAVAPVVLNGVGGVEDSVRRFPTIAGLARRVLLKQRVPGYQWDRQPIDVDWTAGMFVVFKREAFAAVQGFDHRRFFMYFEDVDICRRLQRAGWRVVLQPAISVIHDAQRASHRSIRHLRWHLTSAARYFTGI
ncbi:MAG: glycosyltransferase family 2 protein [Burkholderiales bacterium]|uniref:glycosyltransferase family 2 protein n=1 Tax=Roseateles sp. TaxID=1971397 RepID=UPI000FC29526|nr:MAG: glycosyltransferase family 2 protein [Burkholderiales bacterium]